MNPFRPSIRTHYTYFQYDVRQTVQIIDMLVGFCLAGNDEWSGKQTDCLDGFIATTGLRNKIIDGGVHDSGLSCYCLCLLVQPCYKYEQRYKHE